MARRPIPPWMFGQYGYYHYPPMYNYYGPYYRPLFPPPQYFYPYAWPYFPPRPSIPVQGEDDASDECIQRIQGVHLNPPSYPQPQWRMDRPYGPPQPTRSEARTRSKQNGFYDCGKYTDVRITKKPYFVGFASPSANTVIDMENIPDLACSAWFDDDSTESSIDRDCVHFDELRKKAVDRTMDHMTNR